MARLVDKERSGTCASHGIVPTRLKLVENILVHRASEVCHSSITRLVSVRPVFGLVALLLVC